MFRNSWENIRSDIPGKGREKAEEPGPTCAPARLQTALQALYGADEKTFRLWQDQGIRALPCFIIVCRNTARGREGEEVRHGKLPGAWGEQPRHGRWAFAELTEVYRIEEDFEAKVAAEFDGVVGVAIGGGVLPEARP